MHFTIEKNCASVFSALHTLPVNALFQGSHFRRLLTCDDEEIARHYLISNYK